MAAIFPPTPLDTAWSRYIRKAHVDKFKDQIPEHPPPPPLVSVDKHPVICIIGAGAAGLQAARLIDKINAKYNKKIKYEIVEASARVGGRLFTYRFPQGGEGGRYNYFDVGAMRFPDTPYMASTFELFKDLEIKKIPYHFSSPGTYLYYNGHRFQRNETGDAPRPIDDDFKLRRYLGLNRPQRLLELEIKEVQQEKDSKRSKDPKTAEAKPAAEVKPADEAKKPVADSFVDVGVKTTVEAALSGFRKRFAAIQTAKTPEKKEEATKEFWNYINEHDDFSTRGYLHNEFKVPGPVINWLETFDKSTGWYDRSLTETVLESFAFDFPNEEPTSQKVAQDRGGGGGVGSLAETVLESSAVDLPQNDNVSLKVKEGADGGGGGGGGSVLIQPTANGIDWYCVDGGSQTIAEKMAEKLQISHAIRFSRRVTGIGSTKDAKGDPTDEGIQVFCERADGRPDSGTTYSHVISSIPLPCLRTIDMRDCHLDWPTKSALRELQYGPSIKIGILFKENWWGAWGEKPRNIVGGQSYTDLPVRTVVYPSYPAGEKKSRVLIASYCWTEDALRLGSMINQKWSQEERALLDLVMRDLAVIHDIELATLWDLFEDYYAYDWYDNDKTMGAFAFFGPGQFRDIYPHVTKPLARGRLHLIGEATSTNHAWVAGALDSALRGVYEVLSLSYPDILEELKQELKQQKAEWMLTDEWADFDLMDRQIYISSHDLHPSDEDLDGPAPPYGAETAATQ